MSKSLILFFSFLLLSTSHATILMEDASNDEIVDAIILSIKLNDLSCIDRVNNNTMLASSLKIAETFKKNYTLTVSENREQPIITLERPGGRNNKKNEKNVCLVTTDGEFKKVIELNCKSYDKVSKVRINTGTILEPVYQEVTRDGAPFEDLNCK